MDKIRRLSLLCMVIYCDFHKTTYAYRSDAECKGISEKVTFDPLANRCICDRTRCYSRRTPPGVIVDVEDCSLLSIHCDKGMEPNGKETICTACRPGSFKAVEGCEWCTEWTVCNKTEHVLFTGNSTTDRSCGTIVTNGPESTTQTPNQSSSTTGKVTSENIPTPTYIPISPGNVLVNSKSGNSISNDIFYTFCGLCGLILFAALIRSGFVTGLLSARKQAQEHTKELLIPNASDVEKAPYDVEKTVKNVVNNRQFTYVRTEGENPETDNNEEGRMLAVRHETAQKECWEPSSSVSEDSHLNYFSIDK